MRVPGRVALFGLALLFAIALSASGADEPAPLLKPVTPPGAAVRVRLPLSASFPKPTQITARVPNGKKKSDQLDITVALDTLPGNSYITAKKLESWGYDVPKGKDFLLPELLLSASQIAPKVSKGGPDVVVRLTNLKLTVIDAPGSSDNTIYQCDMSLSSASLYQGFERAMEPRLAFTDKFLELTVPSAAVKRPGTDAVKVVEVTANADATLAPAAGPTVLRGGLPVFAYATVNGQESYKTADGKVIPVNVTMASVANWDTGIVVTIGLARGCKVDFDQAAPGMAATGVESKSEMLPGKIKELRLGVYTGTGLKTQKDIVLKDVPVVVDKNASDGMVYLGPKFVETYFKDGVYAGGTEGWKLHGRINPELLFDIKTRPKQKP